jgi:hypothetical protein
VWVFVHNCLLDTLLYWKASITNHIIHNLWVRKLTYLWRIKSLFLLLHYFKCFFQTFTVSKTSFTSGVRESLSSAGVAIGITFSFFLFWWNVQEKFRPGIDFRMDWHWWFVAHGLDWRRGCVVVTTAAAALMRLG